MARRTRLLDPESDGFAQHNRRAPRQDLERIIRECLPRYGYTDCAPGSMGRLLARGLWLPTESRSSFSSTIFIAPVARKNTSRNSLRDCLRTYFVALSLRLTLEKIYFWTACALEACRSSVYPWGGNTFRTQPFRPGA